MCLGVSWHMSNYIKYHNTKKVFFLMIVVIFYVASLYIMNQNSNSSVDLNLVTQDVQPCSANCCCSLNNKNLNLKLTSFLANTCLFTHPAGGVRPLLLPPFLVSTIIVKIRNIQPFSCWILYLDRLCTRLSELPGASTNDTADSSEPEQKQKNELENAGMFCRAKWGKLTLGNSLWVHDTKKPVPHY